MTKTLWGLTIFFSAFLLFQIQPLIAKLILPWFGGAAGVWTTCLVFFQGVLLLGYAYAHAVTRWIPQGFQGLVHLGLLAISLIALPIRLRGGFEAGDPSWHVLVALGLSVGLPYFALTTTSPLLQAWYPRKTGGGVYRFYALSNAGSLLAVLSYPLLVEPFFALSRQAGIWSGAYLLVCAGCAAATFMRRPSTMELPEPDATAAPSPGTMAMWLALPACSSALLLAVTNHLSQNLAAAPLLWVIPLSLYLLSFVFTFSSEKIYARYFFLRLLAVALASMAYALQTRLGAPSLVILVPLFCVGFFICSMVCHGELARLKPVQEHLTLFYFMFSLGGTLGGMFIALAAPRVFDGYFEFPLALGACAVLALMALRRDPEGPVHRARWQPAWLVVVAITIAINASLLTVAYRQRAESRVMVRNFYGVLRETDEDAVSAPGAAAKRGRKRTLLHGPIQHGLQFLSEDRRREPTSYYGRRSGIGLALDVAGRGAPLRVGVIGLGVGTMATYGQAGDEYTFYELNPQVTELARRDFTYLEDSPARITIQEGDARLVLKSQSPQKFNVLALDAFSGDAIPVHLLTREAFEIYFRHLQPQGLLAVHISNSYLDLQPVVARAAAEFGKPAFRIAVRGDEAEGTFTSTWILISENRDLVEAPEIQRGAFQLTPDSASRLWTDDYSSLFGILKWVPD